jgi:hypothetical protein
MLRSMNSDMLRWTPNTFYYYQNIVESMAEYEALYRYLYYNLPPSHFISKTRHLSEPHSKLRPQTGGTSAIVKIVSAQRTFRNVYTLCESS